MNIHFCLFDKECREYDAPRRVYIHFTRGSIFIGATAQLYLPRIGYTKFRSPIVWHPKGGGKVRQPTKWSSPHAMNIIFVPPDFDKK